MDKMDTAPAASSTTATSTAPGNAVNQLYEIAHKLDANPSFADDNLLFEQILTLSKTTKQTKQLSTQFLAKYFKRFPALQERALDGLIDLIEEDDIPIRVGALKSIPSICRDNPDYIAKLVDILGQLLNTDSPIELENTKNSLVELYKLNSATTLNSVLTILESDTQKEYILKFLKEKLIALIKIDYKSSQSEAQTFFRERILKLVSVATDEESDVLLELFQCFPEYTVKDIVTYLDFIIPQFEAKQLNEYKKKLTYLVKLLIKRSKKQQEPVQCKIFNFYSTKIFPNFNALDDANKTEMLTLFAQISHLAYPNESASLFEQIFNLLKENIPTPVPEQYEFNLQNLEALLLSFSSLGAKSPSLMRSLCGYKTNTGQPSDMAVDLDPKVFDEFVARLRVLNEKIGVTDAKLKKAKEVIQKNDPERAKVDQTFAITQNIIPLIKNLSKNPPILHHNLIPSFSIKQQKNPIHKFYKNNNNNNKSNNNNNNNKSNNNTQGAGKQSKDQPKSRYSPYVPPNLRSGGGRNKQGGDDESVVQYTTEKSKKPQQFKGRGSKNF